MLYKDLTSEQQEHLQSTFKAYGSFPEDATHIDFDNTAESKAVVLKYDDGSEYYCFAGDSKKDCWFKAFLVSELAENTYEIPEDFCRITGKILPIGKPSSEQPFPDFSFKLSCGDRPEVRQWLKDNGKIWNGSPSDLTEGLLHCKLLYVYDCGIVTYTEEEGDWEDTRKDWPEIEPTIKVTGYTLTESSKALKQTLDKLSELRNNAEEIQKQIEELEKELGG